MSTSEPSGPATDIASKNGPHPTLTGNTLDPAVSADGTMASTGSGVGGTSESQIRQEGLEHIRSRVDSPSATEGGAQTQPLSFSRSAPPASNPGADDSTVGIPHGAGGVSSARSVQSPVTESDVEGQKGQQTVVGTILSYVGLGGGQASSGQRAADEHANSGDAAGVTGGSGSGTLTERAAETGERAAAATGLTSAAAGATGHEHTGPSAAEEERRTEPTDTTTTTSAATGPDTQPPTLTSDPVKNTAANTTPPKDSDVTTGNPPTDSADPATSDTAAPSTSNDTSKPSEGKPSEEKPSNAAEDHAAKMKEGNKYNESAIPTAGGERLGIKHWGESKMVSDNPKPAEGTGVSSADGQPTDEVRENTAKNATAGGTGSSAGDDDAVGKEKLVDKIKDKLHIGHHKK